MIKMAGKYSNHIQVSVCMPAHNASQYIEEAIESVLAQDYGPFELLIADDGSTDDTFRIIKGYRTHPKIRVYSNKKNLGVGAARNKLLRLGRGKYITPCDADDMMLPGNLKRLSGFLDTHPNIGVVYADCLVLETSKDNHLLTAPYVLGKDYHTVWDLIDNAINHPGSMIRRPLVLRVGGYNETVYSVDDWDLWLKLAEITQFKYLKGEVYYIWRRNFGSLTRTDKRWYLDYQRIFREAVKRRYGTTLEWV